MIAATYPSRLPFSSLAHTTDDTWPSGQVASKDGTGYSWTQAKDNCLICMPPCVGTAKVRIREKLLRLRCWYTTAGSSLEASHSMNREGQVSKQIKARGAAGSSPVGEELMVQWRPVRGRVLGEELLVRGRHWGPPKQRPAGGRPTMRGAGHTGARLH